MDGREIREYIFGGEGGMGSVIRMYCVIEWNWFRNY